MPVKFNIVFQPPVPEYSRAKEYIDKSIELPVKLAISIALLIPVPSTYSEIKSSVGLEEPANVINVSVLLTKEVFPAASFAYTVKS